MHFGTKNLQFNYHFDNNNIILSKCEKILGVLINNKMSFEEHIYENVNKAHRMCNLILRNVKNVNNSVLIKLYKCFVRPLLEYATVVTSPHHIYLIDLIENVQRRFTKRLYGLHNLCYSDRLESCHLEMLELRRLHADLIMVYKILNGAICVKLDNCLSLSNVRSTRGNVFKLNKYHVKLNIRKFFFGSRIINVWNYLPNEVVQCKTTNNFTRKLKYVNLLCFLKGHACQ